MCRERELSDVTFQPFFAAAAELGATVFIHPVDQALAPRWSKLGAEFGLGMPTDTAAAAIGLILANVFRLAPGLKLLLAHAGGTLPMALPRIAYGQQVVGGAGADADLATSVARQLWCDSLSYDVDCLRLAAARFTEDHVVLGTDYPFAAREKPPGATLRALGADAVSVRRNTLDLLAGTHEPAVSAAC
jgi:aminocarboxymuconate-semialdehyde decarboxylase